MTTPSQTIRRLGPGDESIVRLLAEREPQTALLADDRTRFFGAFSDGEPIGFAFGYVLPRRHGAPSILFVYEVSVEERHRRQGIARRLMEALLAGHDEAFVLTEPDNEAANALYASLGGRRSETVMWDF